MSTVTFYTHVADQRLFACRLAQKAYWAGSRVLVWLPDSISMQKFDALLWSFDAKSFVPHLCWHQGKQPQQAEGVVLAALEPLPELEADTVVLNLADVYWCDAPTPPVRVLEIIGDDVDELAAARERFRAYRQAGFQIEHHSRQGKE